MENRGIFKMITQLNPKEKSYCFYARAKPPKQAPLFFNCGFTSFPSTIKCGGFWLCFRQFYCPSSRLGGVGW